MGKCEWNEIKEMIDFREIGIRVGDLKEGVIRTGVTYVWHWMDGMIYKYIRVGTVY